MTVVKTENIKIITVIFVISSFLVGYVVKVFFETFSVSFGSLAYFYNQDVFRHGIPLGASLVTFLVLNLKKPIRQIIDEAVTEVRKVVWPTKKELYAMTLVVCIILIVSGITLGLFDLSAGTVVKYFLG